MPAARMRSISDGSAATTSSTWPSHQRAPRWLASTVSSKAESAAGGMAVEDRQRLGLAHGPERAGPQPVGHGLPGRVEHPGLDGLQRRHTWRRRRPRGRRSRPGPLPAMARASGWPAASSSSTRGNSSASRPRSPCHHATRPRRAMAPSSPSTSPASAAQPDGVRRGSMASTGAASAARSPRPGRPRPCPAPRAAGSPSQRSSRRRAGAAGRWPRPAGCRQHVVEARRRGPG